MSDALCLQTFADRVGSPATLHAPGLPPLPVTLTEAAPGAPEACRQATEQGRRPPFALLFTGPAQPVLPQGTYPVDLPELGRLDLFLVPVAGGPDGASYEAVFA